MTRRKAEESDEKSGSDDLGFDTSGVPVPGPLRHKLALIERQKSAYPDRAMHVRWIEEFIAKEEFITADSIADQMLQLQEEDRDKRGERTS